MSIFSNLLASTPAPFDIPQIFRNFVSRWYVYLVFAVALAILICFVIFQKKKRNNLNSTQKLVYTSIMSALCFIGNYFTFNASEVLQISFVATFGFIAGYCLGSGLGFTAAFLGDLICGIVAPRGVYSPIIGLGTGLMAFIPGVIFERFNFNGYFQTIISYIAVFIISTFFVNTLGLVLLYGFPIEVYIAELPIKLLTTAINCAVSLAFIPLFPRILPKDKFFVNK